MSDKPKKKVDAYMKYTGLAFQLAAVVFISIFVGGKIDDRLALDVPLVTILMILLLIGGYFYKLIKDLS